MTVTCSSFFLAYKVFLPWYYSENNPMQQNKSASERVTHKWGKRVVAHPKLQTVLPKYDHWLSKICHTDAYYLAGYCVRLADLVTPISSSYRHHRQLGENNSASNCCCHFFGTLYTQTNMSVWVTNSWKMIKHIFIYKNNSTPQKTNDTKH
jgi:hypothetical protein